MRQRALLLHEAFLLAALFSGLSNAAAKQTATVGGMSLSEDAPERG